MSKNNMAKTIYSWLLSGYKVKEVGSYSPFTGYMLLDGDYINFNNFGSSAVKFSLDSIQWLLDKIFNDTENFYIIDENENMACTDDEMENYCNNTLQTFSFHERFIMSNTVGDCLFTFKGTITEFIKRRYELAKNYSKNHKDENIVHFQVFRKCEEDEIFPYSWNYCTFAI